MSWIFHVQYFIFKLLVKFNHLTIYEYLEGIVKSPIIVSFNFTRDFAEMPSLWSGLGAPSSCSQVMLQI
jgi:hypothetical protein